MDRLGGVQGGGTSLDVQYERRINFKNLIVDIYLQCVTWHMCGSQRGNVWE